MTKIDFVVTWVDGADSAWQAEKARYSHQSSDETLNGDNRYRDMDTFHYWFRAVEAYAPWVNRIFLVTAGHLPSWLDTSHPKLRIVHHAEYIPQAYLPTFNSNVIELNLHRIPDLSEHFVLFNDDFFLNKAVSPEDFFKRDLPRLFAVYRPIIPTKAFNYVEVTNGILLNRYFYDKPAIKRQPWKFFSPGYGKFNLYNALSLFYRGIMGYEQRHVALPSLKSTYAQVWDRVGDQLHLQCLQKFRQPADLNHWAISYWNIESGKFYPQTAKIGKYVPIAEQDQVQQVLEGHRYKMVCINDDESSQDFAAEIAHVRGLLAIKLPQKSAFER